jgi:acetyl-CoA carboxylase biotin carboxyl carrier protein
MARHITSPVAGFLISRLVEPGAAVGPETEVAIVEAMKMHIPVSAEQTGRVVAWLVEEKAEVAEGDALLLLEG